MKKFLIGGFAVVMIAVAVAFNLNVNAESKKVSVLTVANIEALAGNESAGYSCTATLTCCGTNSNTTVSCTGTTGCETLSDIWGYKCKGVKCDKKETLC